ncbi:Polyadenylate-binding protein 2-like protein [Drosera capensis]
MVSFVGFAARALDMLNFTPVNGRAIRVVHSHWDPSIRKSGSGNIFIKNLDKSIDNKALHDTFASFDNILSCKNEEAALKAVGKLNGMLLNDKQVFVGPFVRRQERECVYTNKFNNIYVKNLGDSTTDDDLKKVFGEFGIITSAVVTRDGDGKSKCFGFVSYENADDAVRAVKGLNGKKFDDKEWYVGRAPKISKRELELKGKFEQSLKDAVDKYQGNHLFIKNLDDSIDDKNSRNCFRSLVQLLLARFCAIQVGSVGALITEMNGKMAVNKPLYVAFLRQKEERKARLHVLNAF